MRESPRLPGLRPRKRITKANAATNPKFGTYPKDRKPEDLLQFGVLNLDKPSGPTSHQVSAWVRDIFGVKWCGHGGTLDPQATGVLPTALGHATKGVKALLLAGKEYVTLMRLHQDANEAKVREAAESFVGKVKQLPPVRSAVARRVRKREIYYLEVLEVKGRDVLFRAGCEAGTYIRNLCIDIGKKLGTRAHMQQLRRSRTGPFSIEDTVTLQDAKDAYVEYKEGNPAELMRVLQPMESLFTHLPKLVLRDSAIGAVCHGAQLAVPGIVALDEGIEPGDEVLLESLKGEAVALAEAQIDSKKLADQEVGVAAKPIRILLPKETYPKVWKHHASTP
ncbi:MAG: RNA-guided pseudouridylation complex pseudouridine synthase subunit Cbf5 [Euryarchaeota archaeon]|nr:RNA-guided pseudouridylation complex pseudouridine synthase subunit Cbf5 [Euryarchaeota archaeon]